MNMKSFIKQFVATVKGDDATAVAEKAKRQAVSGLKSQIARLEGSTIDFEENLASAKEGLNLSSINNGELITDRDRYVENLLMAQNRIIQCELDLENHNRKITFLKGRLEFAENVD